MKSNSFSKPQPLGLVIFGASGDLTRKKLIPALYHLFKEDLLPEKFFVVGASRTKYSLEEFHNLLKPVVASHSRSGMEDEIWGRFTKNLYYYALDATRADDFNGLKNFVEQLGQGFLHNHLFYLSVSPEFFAPIAANLKSSGLVKPPSDSEQKSVIIFEKPFGHDLESAHALNKSIRQSVAEEQIYRIDHFLGKEIVQNILVLRFANGIFEPLWNYRYIDNIQISVCEDIGVGSRAGYFDKSGILRDIVQNHLLQILALLCIEPPTSLSDPNSIRDEKVKVIKALRPMNIEDVFTRTIRGQYVDGQENGQAIPGYLQEPGVSLDSTTETFIAMRLEINNWRWFGVPIYVRAGKRLPKRVTEVTVFFKRGPDTFFEGVSSGAIEQNTLTIRIQPDEGISIKVNSKPPGNTVSTRPVVLDFSYGDYYDGPSPEAYERLLLDAMKGDSTLFIRDDEIEAAWAFLEPVFDAWKSVEPPPLLGYKPGSWGPEVSDKIMIAPHHKWHSI